jgi:hypothetical protein
LNIKKNNLTAQGVRSQEPEVRIQEREVRMKEPAKKFEELAVWQKAHQFVLSEGLIYCIQ